MSLSKSIENNVGSSLQNIMLHYANNSERCLEYSWLHVSSGHSDLTETFSVDCADSYMTAVDLTLAWLDWAPQRFTWLPIPRSAGIP